MSLDIRPFQQIIYRDVALMLEQALRQLRAEYGMAGGLIDGGSISPGSLPATGIAHALQSEAHTDVDHTTLPKDGEALLWKAALLRWAPGPAGMQDPTTSAGDLIIRDLTDQLARLAIGTGGQVLTVVGGVPVWQTPASTSASAQLLFFNSEILLFNSDGITFG